MPSLLCETPKSQGYLLYGFASNPPSPPSRSNAKIGSTTPVSLPSVESEIPGGNSPSPSAIKYSIESPAGKSGSITVN